MGIAWSPDMSVGVSEIDEQHKELFRHVNNLLESCEQGNGVEYLGDMIGFLESYVSEHFASEERYMVRFQFPSMALHRAQHQVFRKNLLDLRARLQTEGPGEQLLKSTYALVVMWLNHHIRNLDRALGAYLKDRLGVASQF